MMRRPLGQTYVSAKFRASRPRRRVTPKIKVDFYVDPASIERAVAKMNKTLGTYVPGKGYANGGLITNPGLVYIGERGPEVIIGS